MEPWVQRVLEEQAAKAEATGDLRFLGTVERLAGSPTGTGAGGSGARDTTYYWENPGLYKQPNLEAFSANAFNYGLTPPQNWGEVGGFDPDLTMAEMLNRHGLSGMKALLAEIGLGALDGFGPGDLLLLGSALPRQLMDALGSVTRAARNGVPIRMLHGTRNVYGDIDPGRFNRFAMLGRGYYMTEGNWRGNYDPSEYLYQSSRATLTPDWTNPNAKPNQFSWVPAPNEQPLPSRLPPGAKANEVELVSGSYSGAVNRGAPLPPDARPNVRMQYIDTRNPLDLSRVITRQDIPAFTSTVVPGLDPADVDVLKGLSDRLYGTESRWKDALIEGINRQITDGMITGEIATPDITNGMVLEAMEKLLARSSGWGFRDTVRMALRGGKYDSVVGQSPDMGGTIYGNRPQRGPRAWFVDNPEQVIPAGDVIRAMLNMANRGIIDPNNEVMQRLFGAYESLYRKLNLPR